jgi:uncharacterized protein
VAVSGGVDSMTLAVVAHRNVEGVEVFHAVSPAVPAAATARVRRYAGRESWRLREIDAGEMDDPRYVANPVDRCFHCKRDLYASVGRHTALPIASGANVDDLDDYRPGLEAARRAAVRHPFVEAGLDKADIRAIAAGLGLDDLADLPSAPCLASRIETGIAVDARWLRTIDAAESMLRAELPGGTVRCRLRADRISVELDVEILDALPDAERARLVASVDRLWREAAVDLPIRLEPYRRGSAFLRVLT